MSLDYLPLPASFSHLPTYNPFEADLSRLWPEVHQACLNVSTETAPQVHPETSNQSVIAADATQNLPDTHSPDPAQTDVNASDRQPGSQSCFSLSDLSKIPGFSPTELFSGPSEDERKRRRSSTLSIPNCRSPAYKMFKCTLDPHCEMEFTRAEHLARHERKHTKEKPFKCHCLKSFSRLDNWRQHKISVHKNEVEENSNTEERLIKVHKDMQRQNNIRKAVTIASQQQGRLEQSPLVSEHAGTSSLASPYTMQACSMDGSRGQSEYQLKLSHPPAQLGAALMLFSGSAPLESPNQRIDFAPRPASYSPMNVADRLAPNGALSPFLQPCFPLQPTHSTAASYYMPSYPVFPPAANFTYPSLDFYTMMTPSSEPTSSEATFSPRSQPSFAAPPTYGPIPQSTPQRPIPQSTPQRSFSIPGVQSEEWAQGMSRKRDFFASLEEQSPPLQSWHKRFRGSV